MITIEGYHIIAKLSESADSEVYRAIRKADGKTAVLKVSGNRLAGEMSGCEHEYQILKRLENVSGVIQVLGIEQPHDKSVLIIEDFGGESLERYLRAGSFPLEKGLEIGIAIAEILGEIHTLGIIHKRIEPANILLHPETGEIRIIDFGAALMASQEHPAAIDPNRIEGKPSYISPEQTGRMNRPVDFRTDFYSLGVTLYEMFTGTPPFSGPDLMDLIYCHIAVRPKPLTRHNPNIPETVSDIVMKLLAKTAEDRYQSALGIKYDLKRCVGELDANGKIGHFPIGGHDVPLGFRVPGKLYGRDNEIRYLLETFNRIMEVKEAPATPAGKPRTPETEIMLISGYSGIGKTALVREIYKPVTRRKGYFVSGKFERIKARPYGAIISAFGDLVRQVLTEHRERLADWRRNLQRAVGANIQILINLIPELELVVGKQPGLVDLPPAESENRLRIAFQNCLEVVAKPEFPVVIFLDDLQWAEPSSLKLIQLMLTARESRNLYLIGAFRENEVHGGHPLVLMIGDLEKNGVTVNRISLSPLELSDVSDLVADTFRCSRDDARSLANLVMDKTGGNPFFINEFLKTLHAETLLDFDFESGAWRWDIEKIRSKGITDNVVELMAAKIEKLSPAIQNVVCMASCIGNRFEPETLAVVCEKPIKKVVDALKVSTAAGFVIAIKTGDAGPGGSKLAFPKFKFAHDRIQQAAYSLIPETRRTYVHLRIGKLLLANATENGEEIIFDIVNQLNLGAERIEKEHDRLELASLNLRVGRKAKSAAAFDPAYGYFATGSKLLGPDAWERHYELIRDLHLEAAEAAYLTGDFEKMESLARDLMEKLDGLADKIKIYEIRIRAFKSQNRLGEAVEAAKEILWFLGVGLPEKPARHHLGIGLVSAFLRIGNKPVKAFGHRRPMEERDALDAMRILAAAASAAYYVDPLLWPLIVIRAMKLTAKYGNSDWSSVVYAGYGVLLCGLSGNIDRGYKFGKLAIKMVNRHKAKYLKARILFLFNGFIMHWKQHARKALKPLMKAYRQGLETGDFEFACLAAHVRCYISCHVGRELGGLEREMASFSDVFARFNQEKALSDNARYRQLVLNLIGRSENPCLLIGEAYDERVMLPLHIKNNDRTAIFGVYFHKMVLCFLFHRRAEASENAANAKLYADGISGLLLVPLFNFFESLVLLADYASASGKDQKRILKTVASNQKKMKRWSVHCPANFLHRYYLVKAERNNVLGRDEKAGDYYERAVELAGSGKFINDEALGNELAARFYLSRGKPSTGHAYMTDARQCYLKWGAMAKVGHLDRRYHQVLSEPHIASATALDEVSISAKNLKRYGVDIDLASVTLASQAISGEILQDRLLNILMKIVIKNAGAKKGFLILKERDAFVIKTSTWSGAEIGDASSEAVPLESCREISPAIIHYVARTSEDIVLDDASEDRRFKRDEYVLKRRPKSVLCIPIKRHGALIGILYLENNDIIGAFTPDRVQVLHILASQAAISIENARFYKKIEESEKKYRGIFNNVAEGIFQISPAGRIVSANPALFWIMGYDTSTDLSKSRFSLARQCYADPKDYEKVTETLEKTGRVMGFETRFRQHDGNVIWVSINIWKVTGPKGELVRHEGTIVDITVRKVAEENLKRYREDLEELVRERTLELTRTNEKLTLAVREQKEYARELTMLSQMSDQLHECRKEKETWQVVEDICGNLFPSDSGYLCISDPSTGSFAKAASWGMHESGDPGPVKNECPVLRNHQRAIRKTPVNGLPACRFLNPAPAYGHLCIPLAAQGETPGIFHIRFGNPGDEYDADSKSRVFEKKRMLAVRITEQYALFLSNMRLMETLRQESIHDPLTGIYNRRYMEKTLEREVSRAERRKSPIGIIMIDIDRFKLFNDTHGHETGDNVLRKLGFFLKKHIRKEDIACRYGGEEFTLIIPGMTARETGKRAEQLRIGIEKDIRFSRNGNILSVTVSMGVAAYPEHGPTIRDTQNLADLALYRAKKEGRNRVVTYNFSIAEVLTHS